MNRQDISVVIPAQNEADTIREVISEAKKMSPLEINVVVNGSTDQTAEICRSLQCKVFEFSRPLGNDVGRAIGAYFTKGDIVLFLDGDIPVPAHLLQRFVAAIRKGHDVALNNLSFLYDYGFPHYTTLAKMVLNRMMGRMDLSLNSLLAIPHALSRKAIAEIGWKNLAFPVVAQAIAVDKKLSIISPVTVDVITTNKRRDMHANIRNSPFPESTERILGDHLEGLKYWIERYGSRGGLTDGFRNREFLRHYSVPERNRKAKRSAIIPVGEEKDTIREVIRSARKAGADEIIVVANGADEETVQRAMDTGAYVLVFKQRLGHNVGRAVGAAFSTGDVLLFIDGDFVIEPNDLIPFFQSVENGGVDIALNRLDSIFRQPDPINSVKYFLNCCCRRPDLLNGSMTAVPHAIHRRVLDHIGFRSLMIPPLAQLKGILAGFHIANVHYVDVITPNRIREDHKITGGTIPAFERIIGDHVEALDVLLQLTDSRGGFYDGNRYREMLNIVERVR